MAFSTGRLPPPPPMKLTRTYPTHSPNQRMRTVTVSGARSQDDLSRSISVWFTGSAAAERESRSGVRRAIFDYRGHSPTLWRGAQFAEPLTQLFASPYDTWAPTGPICSTRV